MDLCPPQAGIPFLLPQRSSRGMAGVLFLLASGILYVTVEASRDATILPWGEIGFSLCLAGFLLSTSRMLFQAKGGIQHTATELWVGGVEKGLRLSSQDNFHLVLHKRKYGSSEDASEVWEVEARTPEGIIILLGESGDENAARDLLEMLSRDRPNLSTEHLENFSPVRDSPPRSSGTLSGGGALLLPLMLGSLTFLWAGIGFWTAASGALSFVLGPPFALLGLALLLARGGLRLAQLSWELSREGMVWKLTVAGIPVATRSLASSEGHYGRLRPGGVRGWSIEWVGPEGSWALVGSLTAANLEGMKPSFERILSELNQA